MSISHHPKVESKERGTDRVRGNRPGSPLRPRPLSPERTETRKERWCSRVGDSSSLIVTKSVGRRRPGPLLRDMEDLRTEDPL